jgi:hypothetical protein
MARRPAPQRPVPAALERLAKLTGAGAVPDRMVRETQAFLNDWRAEGLPLDELTERMETLREDLEGGLESAVEQAADLSRDDKAALRDATRVVDGLRGALGVVTQAMTAS